MAGSFDNNPEGPVVYQGDPVFKGCTRPAMFWGIPLVPFMLVTGGLLILALWVSLFLLVAIVPVLLAMKHIAKSDDQAFRLLYMRLLFRVINWNRNGRFWKASTYSPLSFHKRK